MKRWAAAALLGVALLAAVGIWGFKQYQARQDLEIFLTNSYHLSFFNLATHVQNLETALAKSLVATGDGEDVAIFSEIWLRSDAAQENLTQLPVYSPVIERTARFLTQVGDYSYTVSKEIIDTGELSEEHWNTLNRLYRQASELNQDINDMEQRVVEGRLTLGQMQANAQRQLEEAQQDINGDLENINKTMQTYPTLIYDGPFSDHLQKRKPTGLRGDQITSEQARDIALKFVDKENENYTARVQGKNKGRITAYTVELIPRNNQDNSPRYTVDVSEHGGKVIWYIGNRSVGDATISVDEARQKGLEFLASRDKENMKATYHSRRGNLVTIQYANTQDDVILYPEQAKLTVAMDDGRVLSYEATQYWMCHRERNLDQPKLSREEAQRKLNSHMNVENARLAVIPIENLDEVLCWEFVGTVNQDTYLVYINAETGKRESIRMLVDTPNGQLTM